MVPDVLKKKGGGDFGRKSDRRRRHNLCRKHEVNVRAPRKKRKKETISSLGWGQERERERERERDKRGLREIEERESI